MVGTAKSIFEVEVKDQAFKRFQDNVKKYKDDLKEMPGMWAAMGKSGQKAFEGVAAAMSMNNKHVIEYLDNQKKIADLQKKEEGQLRKNADRWKKIEHSASNIAKSAFNTTKTIMKWATIGTVGGLAGGFWGLGRMSSNVADIRRSSMGYGISIGQQQAFENSFSRLVNPLQYLNAVQSGQTDISKRWAFHGVGLAEDQISGGNPAQLAVKMLPMLKRIADQTNPAVMSQVMQARGIDQFMSVQDMIRLRNMSKEELQTQIKQYRQNQRQLDIGKRTARRWHDFNTALGQAKEKLEIAFVNGLTPLIPALGKLANSFSNAVNIFFQSKYIKKWIGELGVKLEQFAKYLSSEKFQTDFTKALDKLKYFGEAMGHVADLIMDVYHLFHRTPKEINDQGKNPQTPNINSQASAWRNAFAYGARPENNPGNLRPVGGQGFRHFSSLAEGYKALQDQLMLYYTGKSRAAGYRKLNTVSQIISTYAPKADKNDTSSYIRNVSSALGVGENETLNLNDKRVMASLIAAITHQEGYKPNQQVINQVTGTSSGAVRATTPTIKVDVYNATGANVDVSTAGYAGVW